MRPSTTIADPTELRRLLGAMRGEHGFTASQKLLHGGFTFLVLGVVFPAGIAFGLAEGTPAPWLYVGLILGIAVSVLAAAATWDHVQSRLFVNDLELRRLSPFTWANWALPVQHVSLIRIRRNRSSLVLTVSAQGKKRSCFLPPGLQATVARITGA